MSDCDQIRVQLTVEGGFAGLAARRFTVDSSQLAEPTAAKLRTEVAEACGPGFTDSSLSGTPDVLIYHLDVSGGVSTGSLTFDDVTASPELRALVAHVQELVDGTFVTDSVSDTD